MFIRDIHLCYASPTQLVCTWETVSEGLLGGSKGSSSGSSSSSRKAPLGGVVSPPFTDSGYVWHFQYTPTWLGRWLEGGVRLRVPFIVLSELEAGQRYRVRVRARQRGAGTSTAWGPWTESPSEFFTLLPPPSQGALPPKTPQVQRLSAACLVSAEERACNWVASAAQRLNPSTLHPMGTSATMLAVKMCLQCVFTSGLLPSPLLPLTCVAQWGGGGGGGGGGAARQQVASGAGAVKASPNASPSFFSSPPRPSQGGIHSVAGTPISPFLPWRRKEQQLEQHQGNGVQPWDGITDTFLKKLMAPYCWGERDEDEEEGDDGVFRGVGFEGGGEGEGEDEEEEEDSWGAIPSKPPPVSAFQASSPLPTTPSIKSSLSHHKLRYGGLGVGGTKASPAVALGVEKRGERREEGTEAVVACEDCKAPFIGPTSGRGRGGICFGCQRYLCLKCRRHVIYTGVRDEEVGSGSGNGSGSGKGKGKSAFSSPSTFIPTIISAYPVCHSCVMGSAAYTAHIDKAFHSDVLDNGVVVTLPPPLLILPHPDAEDAAFSGLHATIKPHFAATSQLQLVTSTASPAFLLWLTSRVLTSIRSAGIFDTLGEEGKGGGGGRGEEEDEEEELDVDDIYGEEDAVLEAYSSLEDGEGNGGGESTPTGGSRKGGVRPPSLEKLSAIIALCATAVESFRLSFTEAHPWSPLMVQRGMSSALRDIPLECLPLSLPSPPTTLQCTYLTGILSSPFMAPSSAIPGLQLTSATPPRTPSTSRQQLQQPTPSSPINFPLHSYLHAARGFIKTAFSSSLGGWAPPLPQSSPTSSTFTTIAATTTTTPAHHLPSPIFLAGSHYTPQPVFIHSDGKVVLPPPTHHPAIILADTLSRVPSMLEYLLHTQQFSGDVATRPLALKRVIAAGGAAAGKGGRRRKGGGARIVYKEDGECVEVGDKGEGGFTPPPPPHPSAAIELVMEPTTAPGALGAPAAPPPSPTFLYEYLHQARLDLTREPGVLLMPHPESPTPLVSPPTASTPFTPTLSTGWGGAQKVVYPPWSPSTFGGSAVTPPVTPSTSSPSSSTNPPLFARLGTGELLSGMEACIQANVLPIVRHLCKNLCGGGGREEGVIVGRLGQCKPPLPSPISIPTAATALVQALAAQPAIIARTITHCILVSLSRTHGGGDSHAVTHAMFSGPGTAPPANPADPMPRRLVLLRHAQPTRWSTPSLGLNTATLQSSPPLSLTFPPPMGVPAAAAAAAATAAGGAGKQPAPAAPNTYPFVASMCDVYEVSDAQNLEGGAWVYILAKVSHKMEIVGGSPPTGTTAATTPVASALAFEEVCGEYIGALLAMLKERGGVGGVLPPTFYAMAADQALRSATRKGFLPSLKDVSNTPHRLLHLTPVPRERGEVRVTFLRARDMGVVSLGEGDEEEMRFNEDHPHSPSPMPTGKGKGKGGGAVGGANNFGAGLNPNTVLLARAILRALLIQGIPVHSFSDILGAVMKEKGGARLLPSGLGKREEVDIVNSLATSDGGGVGGGEEGGSGGGGASKANKITAFTRRYGLRGAFVGGVSGGVSLGSPLKPSSSSSKGAPLSLMGSDLQLLTTPGGLLTPLLPTKQPSSNKLVLPPTFRLKAVVRSGPGVECETGEAGGKGGVEGSGVQKTPTPAATSQSPTSPSSKSANPSSPSSSSSSSSSSSPVEPLFQWSWGNEKVVLPWDGVSPVTFSVYGDGGGAGGSVFLGSAALSAASLFPGIPERSTLFLLTKLAVAIPVRHREDGSCGCGRVASKRGAGGGESEGGGGVQVALTNGEGGLKEYPEEEEEVEEELEEEDGDQNIDAPPADHFAHPLRFEGVEDGSNAPTRNICRWISQVVELRTGEVDCELYFWPRDQLTPVIPDAVKAKRAERRSRVAASSRGEVKGV